MANGLGLLIAVRFLLGVGEAVLYPASSQFVARWIPVNERGRANGWIFAGVGAGAGLSVPVLTWLVDRQGWRSCFWFAAVVGLVVGALWYWASRDTPEELPWVSAGELELIQRGRSVGGSAAAGADGAPASTWSAAILNRNVAALSLSYFTYGYVAWIFFSWFFTYLLQVRGLDLKSSAVFSMIPFLAMVVGCLGGGWISDALTARLGRRVGRCGVAGIALVVTAVFLAVGSQAGEARVAAVILAGGAGALVLGGECGYRGAALGSSVGSDEHGGPDRRGGDGVADAVDCGAIWLDERVFCGGGAGGGGRSGVGAR
jgi:ACS family glucarate transporter-like MFS transporter